MSSKILIFGSHSTKNKGDLAILQSIIENIILLNKNVEFFIPSKKPKLLNLYLSKFSNKNILNIYYSITGYLGLEIFYYLKKVDLILIGGGGLFFSRKIFNPFYNHIINIYIIILLNKYIYKKPVVLFSVGSSHLKNNFSKHILKFILRNINLIIVRDQFTFDLFSKLIKYKKVYINYDPAFLLKSEKIDIKIINKQKSILFCLNNYIFDLKGNQYRSLLDVIKKMSTLFNIYLYQNDSKLDIINKIKSDLRKINNIFIIKDKNYTPGQLISLSGMFNFVISAPMHFSIFSYISGANLVSLIYDDKVYNFSKIIKNSNIVTFDKIKDIPEIIQNYKNNNFEKKENIINNSMGAFYKLKKFIK